jgi:hypothetical protein
MKTQDRSALFFRPGSTTVGASFLLRSALLFLCLFVWAVARSALNTIAQMVGGK